jgi:phenylacetate-CoA ligase
MHPGDARWVACTLADHMMWSSASMVGGVLQNIPGINYIGAGAIDRQVFRRILAYPGTKAIMGISRSIADLVAFAEHASAEERASLRIALYGSGALQPKVHAELRTAYPNLTVLSFFAAMQAETIGLQLDPASAVLTAIPGLHHIEIVDDENRAVAVGEEGDLLVTRLFGNGAPVLRYRLGDRMIRHSDRVSGPLNAMQFEYAGRSSDRFVLAGAAFFAPRAIAAIAQSLRARGVVDLDRVADDIQIELDHANRRLTIVAVASGSRDFAVDIDPHAATDAIRAAFAAVEADELRRSGFRFELAIVPPGSPLLATTEVGKTPLLVERR